MSASPKRSALKHRSSQRSAGAASGAIATGSSGHDHNDNKDSSSDALANVATASTTTTQEPANDGAQDTITVLAHVREKIVAVHCGFGTQQVVWIGHVAIARYDDDDSGNGNGDGMAHQGWLALGTPTAITKASISSNKRDALRFTDLICDVLADGAHVYIETSLGG